MVEILKHVTTNQPTYLMIASSLWKCDVQLFYLGANMIRNLLFLILIAGVPSLSSASVSDGRLPSCHSFIWAVFESAKNKKM